MARRSRNKGRAVHGVLLLDKPLGLTSNKALQKVKTLFNANKAGHTGSLDPLATGMLPICLGEATKLSTYLLDADKGYVGTCKLGVRTSSADAEGEVIETREVGEYSEARVLEVLNQFVGAIEQIPPMHSAIKQNGQPLYKLAHQGIEVERKARSVQIYKLELLRLAGDELEIEVHCSKGTYIRTLAEDIGEALGCGAHLSALRRSFVASFQDMPMYTLEQLEAIKDEGGEQALDQTLLGMGDALSDWPEVELSESMLFYVRQGQAVMVSQAPTEGFVRLVAGDHDFVGIGIVQDDGMIAPKRLMNH